MTAGSDPASSGGSPSSSSGPSASLVSSVPSPDGLVLSPFRALRFDTTVAGDLATLTSPPYDVIDADGVSALEASSEHNVVRLILPRDPDGGTQDTDANRYARARR